MRPRYDCRTARTPRMSRTPLTLIVATAWSAIVSEWTNEIAARSLEGLSQVRVLALSMTTEAMNEGTLS